MKNICKRLDINTKIYKERALLGAISSAKDELIGVSEYALNAANDMNQRTYAMVYREYQETLQKNNALDFDDLIVKTVELFKSCPEILDSYQERFQYIMVDEYQDTNTAQFELVRLLAQKNRNLCVVGDDDQSIYKFRGANIRNILDFEKYFPEAKVIKLEQNYRSTQSINNFIQWKFIVSIRFDDLTQRSKDTVCMSAKNSLYQRHGQPFLDFLPVINRIRRNLKIARITNRHKIICNWNNSII